MNKTAGAADAVKAGVGKFTRAFKGTDVKDMEALLKRAPVNREGLAARVDLGKRLSSAKKQTALARGSVGAVGAAVGTGAIAAATKKG